MNIAKLKIFLGVILYSVFINISYIYIIHPEFNYMGLIYKEVPLYILLIATLLSLVPILFLPNSISRPSQVIVWILYLVIIIPNTYVSLYTLYLDYINILFIQGVLIVNILVLNLMCRLPRIKLPIIKIKLSVFVFLIICVSLVNYCYLFFVFGFRFNLGVFADISNAYDLREGFREAGTKLSMYLINWQSKVFNILLIAIGLVYRKKSLLVIALFGQLLLFMISGHKTFIFSFVFLIGLIYCLKNQGKNFGMKMTYCLLALVASTLIIDQLLQSTIFSTLFVRRFLIVPSHLTGLYFEFFSLNEKGYWAYSFLKGFFDYPYDVTPPFLIGYIYFHKINMSANANLWADGFANLGILGVFLVTFILGMILWVYDNLVGRKDIVLYGLFLGMASIDLTNGSLFTVLITHGLILVVLLAIFAPNVNNGK
ncbi:O-antigen polymerase [Bacillus cereus group sp. TH260-2LC]|uniref:O-antigen polymerase n=1 Tax=unclassified Bacillus cereus group TaxID=2750818 RepID=UPI0022E5338A|nr:O-antigen ligase [Bacillus cereus group sp. TH260-2LC]MDA1529864.1 O-antigen ligase [Bacillus cereus group sp. TH260-2LC]